MPQEADSADRSRLGQVAQALEAPRLRRQNAKLTERLSEALGDEVFAEAGMTRTDETATLRARVETLEQQLLDYREKFREQDDDLAAARAANRELMTSLNASRAGP